jgi:transposase
MQVFGLPGQTIRNGRAAARLLAAQPPNIEAERRRAAVARWLRARADGLNAEQAARAVGVPRSTLYRWEKDAAPKSRRPHRVRPKAWTPALRQAVERLRQDFPMWGRAKIGPLLRAEGFGVSDATVGRLLAELVERGVVQAVPTLRRRPYARRWTAKRRFARRLPRGLVVTEPGGLVQLDTVFVNLTPAKSDQALHRL